MLAGRTAGTAAKPLQLRFTLLTPRGSRTFVLPPLALIGLLGVIPVIAMLLIASAGYFIFHDDLLASLTRRQIAMQYSYEEQTARLRHEVIDLTQHAKINEARLTERLGDLAQQQSQLESQTRLVARLTARANALDGVRSAKAPESPARETNPLLSGAFAPKLPSSVRAYAPKNSMDAEGYPSQNAKPQPEGFELRLDGRAAPERSSKAEPARAILSPLSFDYDQPLIKRLDRLAERQQRLGHRQMALLIDLWQPARRIAHIYRAAFNAAGIAPGHLTRPAKQTDEGGPFVPLPTNSTESAGFAKAAIEAENVIASAEKLRRLASHVPFAAPFRGQMEVTSPFGARIDPFLDRPALHTGVDLRQEYGAPVHATAAGIVAFAGSDGGYGNMVEINHGNGLSTRYAHLSSLSVRRGDKVETGTIVGRVGDTGRATGPHLHYETRIDGTPVNPERFLKAGLLLRTANAAIGL